MNALISSVYFFVPDGSLVFEPDFNYLVENAGAGS